MLPVQLYAKYGDGHYPIEIDNHSKAMGGIDLEHLKIHKGEHFFVSGFETEASEGEIVFGVTVPSGLEMHVTFIVRGTTQTEMYFYNGCAITGGTGVTPVNNKLSSSNTSGITLKKDPTISTAGNLKSSTSSGLEADKPSKADVNSFHIRSNELILEDDVYVFKIVSKGDDNIISYLAEWYEVEE